MLTIIRPPSWASLWGEDEKGAWVSFNYKNIEQRFRFIKPGRFMMGSPTDEPDREDIEALHEVQITHGYWIAETTVNQSFYKAVTEKESSDLTGDGSFPVDSVSWDDAIAFIEALNQEADTSFALPTEAQWEYACRAGTTTTFSFGETITSEQVNFDGNFPYNNSEKTTYREKTVPVGSLPVNQWGLYEMHGNLWEWCSDWFGDYDLSEKLQVDPNGPEAGERRVLRGGSWYSDGRSCRSAVRLHFLPDYRSFNFGFRLVSGHPAERQSRSPEEAETGVIASGAQLPKSERKPAKDKRKINFNGRDLQVPTWAADWGVDPNGLFAMLAYKDVEHRFRFISQGQFLMGSPENEPERFSNETQHLVQLTQDYWMAETAVTQELYEAVIGENPSDFVGQQRPVDTVSWDDAKSFIDKFNSEAGLGLRLPTEAEWEFACRAGTTTPFSFGENITSTQVNFDGTRPYNNGPKSEYRSETVDVRSFQSNDWGLYEMHGNVWEWCEDWFGDYESRDLKNPIKDPQGRDSGENRVLRGGSWNNGGGLCRSAVRFPDLPGLRINYIGFRLVSGHPREA